MVEPIPLLPEFAETPPSDLADPAVSGPQTEPQSPAPDATGFTDEHSAGGSEGIFECPHCEKKYFTKPALNVSAEAT